MSAAQLSRRCILAADVQRPGPRAPDPQEAHRAYAWAMDQAAAETRLNRDNWITRPAGDGELIILPEGVYEARVIGVLVPALAARLRDYNQPRDGGQRVRLRVAVHQGLVQLDEALTFPGAATVTVSRLLGCPAARAALNRMPAANVMLIVSAEIYQSFGKARGFRRVRVENRLRGLSTDAWLHSPEGDVNGVEL